MKLTVARATSVVEALAAFRTANGVPANGATARRWYFDLGPIRVHLPNFQWRRSAVDRHDLHHILTGYPCSVRGEFQMAAWEFAAGRYPHPGATMICLPLIAGGAIFTPRHLWHAFLDGRRARTLYEVEMTDELRHGPLEALVPLVGRARRFATSGADRVAFGKLILWAVSLTLLAIGAAVALPLLAWIAV